MNPRAWRKKDRIQQNTRVKDSPERNPKDRTVAPPVKRDPAFVETNMVKAVTGRIVTTLTPVTTPIAGKGIQKFSSKLTNLSADGSRENSTSSLKNSSTIALTQIGQLGTLQEIQDRIEVRCDSAIYQGRLSIGQKRRHKRWVASSLTCHFR